MGTGAPQRISGGSAADIDDCRSDRILACRHRGITRGEEDIVLCASEARIVVFLEKGRLLEFFVLVLVMIEIGRPATCSGRRACTGATGRCRGRG